MTEPSRTAGPTRIGRRSLAAAGLDAPHAALYKQDNRSRVWRTDHATRGPVVIKRFAYNPAKQRLALMAGVHPGQLELRRNRQLAAAGIPVVPIVDAGRERVGLGSRVWLATPHAGDTLQHRFHDADTPAYELARLVDAAAALARRLIAAGYTFKDFKPSNLIIAADGTLRLIDVGSARPGRSARRIEQMLGVMARVMRRDGLSEALCARFRRQV